MKARPVTHVTLSAEKNRNIAAAVAATSLYTCASRAEALSALLCLKTNILQILAISLPTRCRTSTQNLDFKCGKVLHRVRRAERHDHLRFARRDRTEAGAWARIVAVQLTVTMPEQEKSVSNVLQVQFKCAGEAEGMLRLSARIRREEDTAPASRRAAGHSCTFRSIIRSQIHHITDVGAPITPTQIMVYVGTITMPLRHWWHCQK